MMLSIPVKTARITLMAERDAYALGQDIRDAAGFHDGSHGAAGDDAGTGAGGLHDDLGCLVLADKVMGNRSVLYGEPDHRVLGLVDALADGFADVVSLTETVTNVTAPVADYGQGRKGEAATALYDLGRAVQLDELLDEAIVSGIAVSPCLFLLSTVSP